MSAFRARTADVLHAARHEVPGALHGADRLPEPAGVGEGREKIGRASALEGTEAPRPSFQVVVAH